MSLFIQPENQKILWEMIHKIPLCNTVFPPSVDPTFQNEKNNWFKQIIAHFYNKIPSNISRNDLYQINRDVLAAMMKSLGELSLSRQNNLSDRGIFSRLDTPVETKKTEYEIRQSQYKSMFEVQKPTPIDFSEKLDDDVITNMNELIENQRKMRELDLQPFELQNTIQNIKVNILEDVPKESIQPQVIKGSKHVQFDLPNKNGDDLLELKHKIENMEEKINQIFNMLTIFTTPTVITDVLKNEQAEAEAETEAEEEQPKESVEIIKQMMESNDGIK
jgi:hypothetical protein